MLNQTIWKIIFAPALLLCGAAMLWGSAMGQSPETPTEPEPTLIAVPDWETVNSCIAADGDLDIRLNEETADIPNDWIVSCTPADPNATPPEVAPPPGGVEVDEPAIPSPPEPARAAVPIFNPPGEPLDYDDHQTCDKFGGDTEPAVGFPGRHICSNIDINDTFCIVGSKDALPCKGLYDHVLRCNHYNRAALDPFHCAGACETGFACGNKCARTTLISVPSLPEDGIPIFRSPLPESYGNTPILFRVDMAGSPGEAHYELLQDRSILTLSPDVNKPNRANIVLVAPENLLAGETYEVTVRAEFSCAGLEARHHEARLSFDIVSIEGPWPPLSEPGGFLRTSGECGIIRLSDEFHLSIGDGCDLAD